MLRWIRWSGLLGALFASSALAQPPIGPAPKPLTNGVELPKSNGAEAVTAERARLIRQLDELLRRINERPFLPPVDRPPVGSKGRPTPVGPTPRPKFELPETMKPTDGLRIGTNLFQDNDFDGALRTFRLIDTTNMAKEDRAFIQYMTGSCLRRLNRRPEAAAILRDVAEAKDDEFLAECARSQLSLIRSGQELEAQLEQLRSRPKSK